MTKVSIEISEELDRFLSDNSSERALKFAASALLHGTSRYDREHAYFELTDIAPMINELWRATQAGLQQHYISGEENEQDRD